MKKILGALVIALFAVGANAQVFEKGSSIITAQLGIGVGGVYTSTHKVNFANSAEKEYGVEDFKGSSSVGCFGWVSSIGARYYFAEKWAINAEFGWTGAGYFAIGATYKF